MNPARLFVIILIAIAIIASTGLIYQTTIQANNVVDEHFEAASGGGEILSDEQCSSEDIVYVTRTGARYHRQGCRYLARSSIPIERQTAIRLGYTPCRVCRP